MRKSSASQDVGLGTGKNLASARGGRLTPSLMGGFARPAAGSGLRGVAQLG